MLPEDSRHKYDQQVFYDTLNILLAATRSSCMNPSCPQNRLVIRYLLTNLESNLHQKTLLQRPGHWEVIIHKGKEVLTRHYDSNLTTLAKKVQYAS